MTTRDGARRVAKGRQAALLRLQWAACFWSADSSCWQDDRDTYISSEPRLEVPAVIVGYVDREAVSSADACPAAVRADLDQRMTDSLVAPSGGDESRSLPADRVDLTGGRFAQANVLLIRRNGHDC